MDKMESAGNKTRNIVNLIIRRGISARNVNIVTEIVVKILLDRGEDPNSKDKWGLTPVHHAALDQLGSRKTGLENSNSTFYVHNNLNPLAYIILMDNQTQFVPKFMEILLEGGGNPNAMSTDSCMTPIHFAVEKDSKTGFEILKLLLKYGGNPDSVNSHKETPVHLAAKNQSIFGLDILKILLENGGNPNSWDDQLETPVSYAVKNYSDNGLEILNLLLENGGDPNTPDAFLFSSILHYAVFSDKSNFALGIVKLLIQKGANPNAINLDGNTPVHLAVKNESPLRLQILEFLLINGGNPNAGNKKKETPLHIAAKCEERDGPEMMRILLENGGDPNVPTYNGTVVHLAAENFSNSATKIMRLLLEKGGDPNAVNKYNLTPVNVAQVNRSVQRLELVKLLEEYGRKEN